MKKRIVLILMLVGVAVLGFSQASPLSGTYRYGDTSATITFSGNSFRGQWNSTTPIAGTYTVSGDRLMLNVTGGPRAGSTWAWTIVNSTTLRDQDGDRWSIGGSSSSSDIKNYISGEVNILGGGFRYERMLTDKMSIGANAYWQTFFFLWNEIEAGGSFRFYIAPFFYVGGGLGFHIHTGTYEYSYGYGLTGTWWGSITGVALTPDIGFKFDFGDPGGFFLSPGVKVPITFGVREEYLYYMDSEFAVGVGVVPYVGLGFCF
jgi:hypothetical protein